MKTRAVVPARIDWSDAAAPFAPAFDDVYHPRDGALAQARHVFLGGNRLPQRWRGRERFAVLETGFGLGNNFLATWAAWRDDAQRCSRLVYASIDKHPPTAGDMARAHEASSSSPLAQSLVARWPLPTPNLHRIAFDDGRVELLLLFADVADAIGEIVGSFDAFYLDGFAPARNPAMWQPRVLAALGRRAARGATAATWSVAREVRDGLAAAGFVVERAAGFGAKREMTVASFAPRHVVRPLPGRPEPIAARDALIVGAGLAGSAAAAALSAQGYGITVVDRRAAPAGGASGQRGGLFHGIVHRDDGPHARFTRAAALVAEHELRGAIGNRGVAGRMSGFLRLETDRPDPAWMRETIAAQALPAGYVEALDAAAASARAGLSVTVPAWHYPGGGWVDPRALCASWLAAAGAERREGAACTLRCAEDRWQVLDADGRVLASASIVVLAGGADGVALLGGLSTALSVVRGQSSLWPASTPGLRRPALPIADAGYVLTLADGSVLCGASSAAADVNPAPNQADRRANLQRLQHLTDSRIVDTTEELGEERVGFRLVARDRLPLIGPMPGHPSAGQRLDQPRFVPRLPGLYVFSALGSRGITWAPLGARLLAAQIAGSPWPLEASLADAVDPARFVARAVRKPAS